jgi:hypothetical protein
VLPRFYFSTSINGKFDFRLRKHEIIFRELLTNSGISKQKVDNRSCKYVMIVTQISKNYS